MNVLYMRIVHLIMHSIDINKQIHVVIRKL